MLFGQGGNDTLIGGMGEDLLIGASGQNSLIANADEQGYERIIDFTRGDDWTCAIC